MKGKRKSHTPQFKMPMALPAMKTMGELASVHFGTTEFSRPGMRRNGEDHHDSPISQHEFHGLLGRLLPAHGRRLLATGGERADERFRTD